MGELLPTHLKIKARFVSDKAKEGLPNPLFVVKEYEQIYRLGKPEHKDKTPEQIISECSQEFSKSILEESNNDNSN